MTTLSFRVLTFLIAMVLEKIHAITMMITITTPRRRVNYHHSNQKHQTAKGRDIINNQQPPHVELTTFQREKIDLAKSKLSKWAARLFDLNCIRGLGNRPRREFSLFLNYSRERKSLSFFTIYEISIPLNDEFLTAFGKREKEYDELIGQSADIDKTFLDNIINVNGSDDEEVMMIEIKVVVFVERVLVTPSIK